MNQTFMYQYVVEGEIFSVVNAYLSQYVDWTHISDNNVRDLYFYFIVP